MTHSVVVKSFAELAEVINLDDLPAGPAADADASPASSPDPADAAVDIESLLAELESASSTLATIGEEDQAARARALESLEQYDAFVDQQCEAEHTSERAHRVRLEAEALVAAAFTDDARDAAVQIVGIAKQTEAAASHLAEERRQAAEQFAGHLDVERLLAERRCQEEAEKAKAAEAERARRLSGALATVRSTLAVGRLEEAKRLLEPIASEYPGNADVTSVTAMIAQRELVVKVNAAEEALWAARREFRRDPASAVARFEALEVDGLPEPLAKQVFGQWARACARLCRERRIDEPLRYAPDLGRGAVLARARSDSDYVVVSALGMSSRWSAGSVVGERQVRRARPLR